MIFRRLKAHIEKENWFAVAIDFLIVVLGVFIGLQVSNWNEDRENRLRGEIYESRLIANLQIDVETSALTADYFGTVNDYAQTAIRLFNDPDADPGTLLISAYNATQQMRLMQDRTTYQELLATGNFVYLPEDEFRQLIIYYYRVDYIAALGEYVRGSDYRRNLRRVMPFRIQQDIRDNCGDIRGENGYIFGLKTGCAMTLPDAELRAAVDVLRSQPELVEDLQYFLSTLEPRLSDLRAMQNRLDSLLALKTEAARSDKE